MNAKQRGSGAESGQAPFACPRGKTASGPGWAASPKWFRRGGRPRRRMRRWADSLPAQATSQGLAKKAKTSNASSLRKGSAGARRADRVMRARARRVPARPRPSPSRGRLRGAFAGQRNDTSNGFEPPQGKTALAETLPERQRRESQGPCQRRVPDCRRSRTNKKEESPALKDPSFHQRAALQLSNFVHLLTIIRIHF